MDSNLLDIFKLEAHKAHSVQDEKMVSKYPGCFKVRMEEKVTAMGSKVSTWDNT